MNWILAFLLYFAFCITCAILFGIKIKDEITQNSFLCIRSTKSMKGIAMLMVCLTHYMPCYGNGVRYFTPLGGIGVCVFLILSGYGNSIAWSRTHGVDQGGVNWLLRRIIYVWLPYVMTSFLFYWLWNSFDLKCFILDIALIKPRYTLGWFLQYLIFWYFCFFIVRSIGTLNRYSIYIFVVISISTFFIFQPIMAEQSLSFFFGCLLARIQENWNKKNLQKYADKMESWKACLLFITISLLTLAIKQTHSIRNTTIYI